MIAVKLEPISRATLPLPLRPPQCDVAFCAEDVAIEICNPLASARRHVEVANFGLDMRRHAVPVELRIAVDDVGGRNVAGLGVEGDLLVILGDGAGPCDVV